MIAKDGLNQNFNIKKGVFELRTFKFEAEIKTDNPISMENLITRLRNAVEFVPEINQVEFYRLTEITPKPISVRMIVDKNGNVQFQMPNGTAIEEGVYQIIIDK